MTRRKIILLLLGVLLIVVYVYTGRFERKNIYHPDKINTIDSTQWNFKYDDVMVVTKDNIKINGCFIPAENPIATVLFCHGNGGNIGNRLMIVSALRNLNVNIFIFDYRGYGKSEGTPDEQGTYRDAMGAYNYLKTRNEVDMKKIIVYGESLGGAVAIDLAKQEKPAGLIVIDTFTSMYAISTEIYPFMPIRWLMRTKYDSLSKMKDIHCHVLIGHSKEDNVIPFHHGQELYGAANYPKEFLLLHGDHGEACMIGDENAMEQLYNFVLRATAQP